jgi:hypothetical protein
MKDVVMSEVFQPGGSERRGPFAAVWARDYALWDKGPVIWHVRSIDPRRDKASASVSDLICVSPVQRQSAQIVSR